MKLETQATRVTVTSEKVSSDPARIGIFVV
jgi:hypothetical protein